MSNFHFGINISRNKIPKISRETYATIDKRSSFYNDRLWKNSTIFDEEYDVDSLSGHGWEYFIQLKDLSFNEVFVKWIYKFFKVSKLRL